MRLVFTAYAWQDYMHWHSADRAVLKRVDRLIEDALRDPFDGIGKPEQLRHALSGAWSRRITEEHRLVHLVDGDDPRCPAGPLPLSAADGCLGP